MSTEKSLFVNFLDVVRRNRAEGKADLYEILRENVRETYLFIANE